MGIRKKLGLLECLSVKSLNILEVSGKMLRVSRIECLDLLHRVKE